MVHYKQWKISFKQLNKTQKKTVKNRLESKTGVSKVLKGTKKYIKFLVI